MQKESIQINCPGCKTKITWDNTSAFRPFCSESCKNKDFIGWANEEHIMEGNSIYDEVLSEELLMAPNR